MCDSIARANATRRATRWRHADCVLSRFCADPQNDTQLVSILYRTHNGLSSSAKISSLYAFDALARAARSQVNRKHLVASHEKGNCATFLLKIEGVLDGLFRDLASSGGGELKVSPRDRILTRCTPNNVGASCQSIDWHRI